MLASPSDIHEAQELAKLLKSKGYATEVEPIKIKGKQHYRVLIPGLLDAAEVQGLANRITIDFPSMHPWSTF